MTRARRLPRQKNEEGAPAPEPTVPVPRRLPPVPLSAPLLLPQALMSLPLLRGPGHQPPQATSPGSFPRTSIQTRGCADQSEIPVCSGRRVWAGGGAARTIRAGRGGGGARERSGALSHRGRGRVPAAGFEILWLHPGWVLQSRPSACLPPRPHFTV